MGRSALPRSTLRLRCGGHHPSRCRGGGAHRKTGDGGTGRWRWLPLRIRLAARPGAKPLERALLVGGSSSGSASAVAAGLAPFALGSETWGSIMTPACYCGITGLRPTSGQVSRAGAMELAGSMDKIGPLAHSAEDCGWVLQSIAGHDPNDAATASQKFVFQRRVRRHGFRLGVLPLDYGTAPGGAETAEGFEEALRVLRGAGMKVAAGGWPDYPYTDIARTVLGGEVAAVHEEFIRSERLDELVDTGQRRA